jgi:hypothetical protein
LDNTDDKVKYADLRMTISQSHTQLVQMGSMCAQDIFSAQETPEKRKNRIINKVKQQEGHDKE